MKFFSRVSNFWYHHKWKVIISAFLIFSFAYLSLASLSDHKADFYGVVVTTRVFAEEDKEIICKKLGEAVGDLNGDGEAWATCQFIVLPDLAGGHVDQQAYTVLQTSLLSRRYELFLFSDDIVATGKFDEFLTDHINKSANEEGKFLPLPDDAFSLPAAEAGLHIAMRLDADAMEDPDAFYSVAISVAEYFGLKEDSN